MTVLQRCLIPLFAAALGACATMNSVGTTSSPDAVVTVGGAAMYPDRTIVQNVANSPMHTTLVNAVRAAELVDTLGSAGPFTVFAPTDEAFGWVPSARLDSLMQPSMQAELAELLTYHVVPGRITAADIIARINAGGGSATYRTLAGDDLTFTLADNVIRIAGEQRSVSSVIQADVMQSNGIIHVVDAVLLPGVS